jgi:hypothetical protein
MFPLGLILDHETEEGSNQITTRYSAGSLEIQQIPCLPQNATAKQGWVARLGGTPQQLLEDGKDS